MKYISDTKDFNTIAGKVCVDIVNILPGERKILYKEKVIHKERNKQRKEQQRNKHRKKVSGNTYNTISGRNLSKYYCVYHKFHID
jgi:predicted GTPase